MYKTEGVIIKTLNLGEYDRLITAYTKDFGKLSLRGKALRKNQAKLCGHLDLFLYSHLIIAPARSYDIITGAETIKSFPGLQKNLQSLAAVYYISELFDKLLVAPQKDENIWKLILSFFDTMDKNPDLVQAQIEDTEKKLVYYLGYGEERENIRSLLKELTGQELGSFIFYRSLLF